MQPDAIEEFYEIVPFTIEIEKPKHAVGTQFELKRGKRKDIMTILGYQIVYHTETGNKLATYTYDVFHEFMGQRIYENLARSTVDMAIMKAN